MPEVLRSLSGQALPARVVGVIVGFTGPDFAVKLNPLGQSVNIATDALEKLRATLASLPKPTASAH